MTDKSCSVEKYIRVNSLSIDWRSKKCFRYTTIYDDLGGMHIRRVIRCQKEDSFGNIFRFTVPAQRHAFLYCLHDPCNLFR
jgi:hypothetical protein